MHPAVLVPVKSFAVAKGRLRGVLDDPEREELARWMAGRVLDAAAPFPVYVVCDDESVAAWARGRGAAVVWCPRRGLDAAVGDGVAELARAGHDTVVVAHSDLPFATDLGRFADPAVATLVPDRREDGTNVFAVPSGAGIRFAYGRSSFTRHRAECERLGLAWRVVHDDDLAFDVDTPAELADERIQEVLPWERTNPASPH